MDYMVALSRLHLISLLCRVSAALDLRATQTWLSADTLGLFALLFFIFDDLVLLFLLHVTVQVADQELRICLYVIDGEVKDIFPILSDNTGTCVTVY